LFVKCLFPNPITLSNYFIHGDVHALPGQHNRKK
jgi:hypothetical protein